MLRHELQKSALVPAERGDASLRVAPQSPMAKLAAGQSGRMVGWVEATHKDTLNIHTAENMAPKHIKRLARYAESSERGGNALHGVDD